MKKMFTCCVMVFLLIAAPSESSDTGRRQTLDAVILVTDQFKTADAIEEWVDLNKGYLVSRLEDELILRIPSEVLEEFVAFLEETADDVVEIKQQTENIGQDILEAEAGIKSKTELFERALKLIDQTDLATTLKMEQEVLSILREIEELKGTYRKLTGEMKLARVSVAFTMEDEQLPENLPSAFIWINWVDFYLLMNEFGR